MFGPNGKAPVPIVAPCSPSDAFAAALDAARIAVTYRTPVLLHLIAVNKRYRTRAGVLLTHVDVTRAAG